MSMQHLILSLSVGDCPVHQLRQSFFLTGGYERTLIVSNCVYAASDIVTLCG
jgi:hypothetical protein